MKSVSVDSNSIKAVKEGNHREVYQARKKLEKKGLTVAKKKNSVKVRRYNT